MTVIEEEWRIVVGHNDYDVSSHGRIRSHKSGKPRILKAYIHKLGYARVHIDGVQYSVHRIVAEAWHGPCPEGMETDHINRVRDDNRPENLQYLTRQANMQRIVRPPLVTECSKGHPLSGENLYVKPSGRRACRQCNAETIHLRRRNTGRPCTAEGCDRDAYVRIKTSTALCEMHYQRERKAAKRRANFVQSAEGAA